MDETHYSEHFIGPLFTVGSRCVTYDDYMKLMTSLVVAQMIADD